MAKPRRLRILAPVLVAVLCCLASAGGPLLPASPGRSGNGKAESALPSDPIPRGLAEVRALLDAGRYGESHTRCLALLRSAESLAGPDSLQTAEVLALLMRTNYAQGSVPDKAEYLGTGYRALRIQERLLPPDDPALATTLLALADGLQEMGEFAESETRYSRALEILERVFGPGSAEASEVLSRMGRLDLARGNYERSRDRMKRALGQQEAVLSPDSPRLASTLVSLARLAWETGDYPESRILAERSLEIRVKSLGPWHPEVATSLSMLSLALQYMGDYGGARDAAEKGLEIRMKALGPDHPQVGSSLLNLGLLLEDLGDFDAARALMDRAFALGKASLTPDHPSASRADQNTGELILRQGDPEGARPYLERALRIKQKVNGPEHPILITTLTLLARVFQETGEPSRAQACLDRADAIARKAYGIRHPQIAEILDQRAGLELSRGRYDEAASLARRALDLQRSLLGPDHPAAAPSLNLLAQVAWRRGKTRTAIARSLEAAALVRRHLRQTARVLSEREALCYEASRSTSLDIALSALAYPGPMGDRDRLTERIFDEVIRSRALVLDESASRHRAVLQEQDPGSIQALRAQQEARTRLAWLVTRGPGLRPPEEYRRQIQEARDRKERAERELARTSLGYRQERKKTGAGIQEVRQGLPPGSTLVAYVLYNRLDSVAGRGGGASKTAPRPVPSYLAFLLKSGDGSLVAISLDTSARVDSLVQGWRKAVGSLPADAPAGREFHAAGDALRKLIWDPLAGRLRGARMVLVVPDGALSLVSLATLPTSAEQYLVETGPLIHYLSAERDVLADSMSPAAAGGLLALGGADFDAGGGKSSRGKPNEAAPAFLASLRRGVRPACASFHALRFEPLPGSLAEVRDLEALWRSHSSQANPPGPVKVLTGSGARETEFKRLAPGKRIVHVATHGFMLEGECESDLGRVRAAAEGGLDPGLEFLRGENPLLLTGLALAGANRQEDPDSAMGEEDGILTGEEIASLDLRGTQWAVLSACETGVGSVQAGEGVLGLRRAFQIAGARTLILSLWPVGDQVTREWTRYLYRGSLSGLSTAEAIRAASLEMIRSRRAKGIAPHPFSWGAFVAAGDWR